MHPNHLKSTARIGVALLWSLAALIQSKLKPVTNLGFGFSLLRSGGAALRRLSTCGEVKGVVRFVQNKVNGWQCCSMDLPAN
jgi:hypothetical protein